MAAGLAVAVFTRSSSHLGASATGKSFSHDYAADTGF